MHSLRIRLLSGLCALAFLPSVLACDRQPDAAGNGAAAEEPPAGIATARESWVAGWNGDDPAVVTSAYLDDATATLDDTTYTGRAEIEGWVRDNIMVMSDLQLTAASMQRSGEDWREDGTYSHLTSPPDVEPFMAEGRYMIVWTSGAAGEWRIRATDIQPDPPPES